MKTITQLLQDNKVFIVVLSGMFSLVTAFLGFLLGQVSGYFTARKERKKAISIALAELLEVRHQLFAVEEMTEKMTGLLGNVSEQQKSQARVVVTSLLPKWEETHARYNACVNTIAELDPLLAFYLRSKDYVLQLVNFIHTVIGKDPQSASLIGPVLRTIVSDAFEPVLKKSILVLARKRNWLCWYRTYRLLNKTKTATEDAMQLLKPISDAIQSFNTTGAAVASGSQRTNETKSAQTGS